MTNKEIFKEHQAKIVKLLMEVRSDLKNHKKSSLCNVLLVERHKMLKGLANRRKQLK